MKTLNEIRQGDWMQVHSGKQFWPMDPRAEEIDIGDIAHALSMICRFGGHCKKFYTVAEHSVLISYAVPEEFALYGLLHDAAEAYMLDLPAPIKRFVPDYKFYENVLQHFIFQKFGLSWPVPQEVKAADARILWNEKEALMASVRS
jgi:hypothetical protein